MVFWVSLAVLLVGLLAGLAYAAWRGLSLWRLLKRTGGRFSSEADRIAVASEGIQEHLDRATVSGDRLGDAAARLAVSRARLDVQLHALQEARHTLRRMLWFLPGV